jgi:hypothetical protein
VVLDMNTRPPDMHTLGCALGSLPCAHQAENISLCVMCAKQLSPQRLYYDTCGRSCCQALLAKRRGLFGE